MDYDFTELPIDGIGARALAALTPAQVTFLRELPKAELHAHLNGCIPFPILQELARDYALNNATSIDEGILRLQNGVKLDALQDFFGLFPAIYALTAKHETLSRATHEVLRHFLAGQRPQAAYLELRTTPKATQYLNRREYLETVLDEVEKYPMDRAALIISLDRRMDHATASEVVALAIQLKNEGRRIVAVDLCGDPTASDMNTFKQYFKTAKESGLRVTLHIAETKDNTPEDTMALLECEPDRLGHATFLSEEARDIVCERNTCVEICLTSNVLCKTVDSLDDHHIHHYLSGKHPIVICTDDILPFRNSLLGEYALLLAPKPYGLNFSEEEVARIAKSGMDARFVAA